MSSSAYSNVAASLSVKHVNVVDEAVFEMHTIKPGAVPGTVDITHVDTCTDQMDVIYWLCRWILKWHVQVA
jgi:hypothetical protein